MVATKRQAAPAAKKSPPPKALSPKARKPVPRELPPRIKLSPNPPQRIHSGITDADIGFPRDKFYGYPEDFQFGEYESQFEQLVGVLDRNQMHFHVVGASKNGGFVAVAGLLESPLFIWENYIGDQGKHENNVYLNGIKMMLSTFLKKPEAEQDVLMEPLRLKAWLIQ